MDDTAPTAADESLAVGASVGMGEGLREAGKAVYEALVQPGMDMADISLCEEAGRLRDRLDQLQKLIVGDADTFAEVITVSGETLVLQINGALLEARQLVTVYRQLLGDIKRRWPDAYSGGDADGLEGFGELAYADGPPGA